MSTEKVLTQFASPAEASRFFDLKRTVSSLRDFLSDCSNADVLEHDEKTIQTWFDDLKILETQIRNFEDKYGHIV